MKRTVSGLVLLVLLVVFGPRVGRFVELVKSIGRVAGRQLRRLLFGIYWWVNKYSVLLALCGWVLFLAFMYSGYTTKTVHTYTTKIVRTERTIYQERPVYEEKLVEVPSAEGLLFGFHVGCYMAAKEFAPYYTDEQIVRGCLQWTAAMASDYEELMEKRPEFWIEFWNSEANPLYQPQLNS